LDHAVGDIEFDHGDDTPFVVVQHSARLAVDPGQPERGTEDPAPAKQADKKPCDTLPPGQWLPDGLCSVTLTATPATSRGQAGSCRTARPSPD
jgi:hypothetical protein